MDYLNTYNKIISKAKSENRQKGKGLYYEAHHIKPKCLGADGRVHQYKTHPNIVLLTSKEHFVCHRLLCEIYPNSNKLAYALWSMCNQNKNYKVSSRAYESAREHFIKSKSGENHHFFGKKRTDMIDKIGGEKSASKRIEVRQKIGAAHKGRKLSEEHKNKIKHSTKNKKLSIDHKNNISASKIGKRRLAISGGNNGRAKQIDQFDKCGNFIKRWSCIKDACDFYKLHKSNVCAVCKGKLSSSGGFIWKYC